MLAREVAHLVEVDAVVVLPHAVLHALEVLARDRDGVAVRQVPAGREREAHDGVARLTEREVHGEVRRAARVGLHVDVLGAEERLEPRDGQLLHLVDDLLPLVVALVRVPLGVLVREDRAGRLHHGARGVVLAGDEADLVVLAAVLVGDEAGDLGIGLGEGRDRRRGMAAAAFSHRPVVPRRSRRVVGDPRPVVSPLASMLARCVLFAATSQGPRPPSPPATRHARRRSSTSPHRLPERPRRRALARRGGRPARADTRTTPRTSATRPTTRRAAAWAGTYGSLFVMGALSDYLSFGFLFGHGALQNPDWRSNGDGGGLRIEAFPLVGLVPRCRARRARRVRHRHRRPHLVQAPASRGHRDAVVPAGRASSTSGRFGSLFGGHFGVGPSLEYDAIWSQPFERHGLVASARLVFYGGHVGRYAA